MKIIKKILILILIIVIVFSIKTYAKYNYKYTLNAFSLTIDDNKNISNNINNKN